MADAVDIRYYLPFTRTGRCLRLESGVELELEAERFRVTVLQEDLLLLKISHGGRWDQSPSCAVCADIGSMKSEFSVEESDEEIRLTTTAITLTIFKNPFGLRAVRSDGSVIFQTASDQEGISWAYARLNDHFVTIRRCRHEDAFFGLGEKTGRFNRKGRDFTLWNTDVLNPNATGEFVAKHKSGDPRADPLSPEFDPYYVSIPFFYHLPHLQTAMAGFFFDNPYRATFEFSQLQEYRVHFHGGQYTEFVFAGPAMKDILRDYSMLTGRTPPPPLWRWEITNAAGFPTRRKRLRSSPSCIEKNRFPVTRSGWISTTWMNTGYLLGIEKPSLTRLNCFPVCATRDSVLSRSSIPESSSSRAIRFLIKHPARISCAKRQGELSTLAKYGRGEVHFRTSRSKKHEAGGVGSMPSM